MISRAAATAGAAFADVAAAGATGLAMATVAGATTGAGACAAAAGAVTTGASVAVLVCVGTEAGLPEAAVAAIVAAGAAAAAVAGVARAVAGAAAALAANAAACAAAARAAAVLAGGGAAAGEAGSADVAAVVATGAAVEVADPVVMIGADGEAGVASVGLAETGVCTGGVPDDPLRSVHAAAATKASAANAIPMNIGIRDDVAPVVAFALGVARNCMGLKGSGVSTAVRAKPSFANLSSAACTSSIGRAILCASCATEMGSESSVNSFLCRTERPAAPILV